MSCVHNLVGRIYPKQRTYATSEDVHNTCTPTFMSNIYCIHTRINICMSACRMLNLCPKQYTYAEHEDAYYCYRKSIVVFLFIVITARRTDPSTYSPMSSRDQDLHPIGHLMNKFQLWRTVTINDFQCLGKSPLSHQISDNVLGSFSSWTSIDSVWEVVVSRMRYLIMF